MLSMLCSVALAGTPSTAALPAHMQHHFADATDAVWYVALGDLQRARQAAGRLDHAPDPAMPPERSAEIQRMRDTAHALAEAPDLARAATLSVTLAGACAACHTATGPGPTLEASEAVVPRASEAGQHGMAAYTLWVGLVVPSEAAYQAGARALLPVPGGADPGQVETYQRLAQRLLTAEGEARSLGVAQVFRGCASCHLHSGIRLEP